MTLTDMNPYLRFARRHERAFSPFERIAYDHRLFMLEKGSAVFYLDGESCKAEQGDVIFWRSGLRYRVEASADAVISGCNFDFDRTADTPLLPLYPAAVSQFSGAVQEQICFTDTHAFDHSFCIRNTYGILSKLHELYEEYESKQIFYEQRCSALLKDILVLCVRFGQGNQALSSARITREVLGYIRQHYNEPLSNEHFSEVFHYHPNHLSHLVKEQTGLPLHQYIRSYRVHAALELLQTTELTVAEIAEQVGIGDIHQFSKAFRQIIGTAPSSFRK